MNVNNKQSGTNKNIQKKLLGLQYHDMVNPKTTALPLLTF